MRRNVIFAVGLLILGVACGCSRQEDAQGAQVELARRLREADRVVFIHPVDMRTSLTLNNKRAKEVVRALKRSQEIPPNVEAAVGYTLVFFSGTNRLATVKSSQIIFWIDGKAFEDQSGTLETAYGLAASERHRSGLTF